MIALLLSIILFGQGIPQLATDTGTISGILKTSSGQPASGVRITAMALPENPADTVSASSFGGLAETDKDGRYQLDNIAPGRYYIAAGRVDLPTYFPGTLEMPKGTVVSVAAKAVVPNINFVIDDASVRLPGSEIPSFIGSITGLTLPVQVRMEGNAKQPVMADGRSVLIRLTRTQDQARTEMALHDSIQNFSIPNPVPGMEFRVTVENIPRGYAVRAMVKDGMDLMAGMLKLTATNFAPSDSSVIGAMLPGAYVVPFKSYAGMPMTPLEITLASLPQTGQNDSGVRVTGRAAAAGSWYPSISGKPGILFADGSFEFRGVTAGRHVILLQDKPENPSRVLAASVVAANQDIDNVLADDTRVLPLEVRFPTRTPPAGSIPLAWIHGRVVDDASKMPVFGGAVTVTGKTKATLPIDSAGEFQIPRLLPGTYELVIEGSQHNAIRQSIVVGDEDVQLNLAARATN